MTALLSLDALVASLDMGSELRVSIQGRSFRIVPVGEESKPAIENAAQFMRVGANWLVGYSAEQTTFFDSIGLRYIHRLLKSSPDGISCSSLVSAENSRPVSGPLTNSEEIGDGFSPEGQVAQKVLDQRAVRNIRNAIRDGETEIIALREAGDSEGADETERRIGQLKACLNNSTFQGDSAAFAMSSDRNRKSVLNAIQRAIKSLKKGVPLLSEHLLRSIQTGHVCRYQPDRQLSWKL